MTQDQDRQWSVKYRPTKLSEVVGNTAAVKKVDAFLSRRNAHAVLFHGRSGCGKSTLARIAANLLSDNTPSDVTEENIGSARGIDDIRSIVNKARFLPSNKCRVIIAEEAHALTVQAKSAFLRPLEDPPHDKVVFLLCTDRPWLLDTQILNRTLQIEVKTPTEEELTDYLMRIVSEEDAFPDYGAKAKTRICKEIVRASEFVPRSAVQMLQAAASSYTDYEDARDLIVSSIRTSENVAIDKSALMILGCIYSGQKSIEQRISILVKHATSHDSIGLLNRLLYVNHAVFLSACGSGPPVSHYYMKELAPIGGVPTVSRAAAVSQVLASMKNELTTVNLDPAQYVIPILVQQAINLTKKS